MKHFPGFSYRQNQLFVEDVAVASLAEEYGTPCYVYSKTALQQCWSGLQSAFSDIPFLPCYAVKANSNIAILQLLAEWGTGFDIVSVGELERVLSAGGKAENIMFSGVAKREDELRKAIHVGVGCINVESSYELDKIKSIAEDMQIPAHVSIRINPNVDPQTHPYIATGLHENKFGVPSDVALSLYTAILDDPWVRPVGVDCHIGSQITEPQPFADAAKHVFEFVSQLEEIGVALKHVDLGGGFGIHYNAEEPPSFAMFADVIAPFFKDKPYQLVLEPGRSVVGNAGLLLTRVEYIKQTPVKKFALVDAAMNDLLRPALYNAWHTILPCAEYAERNTQQYDVVGPVCESGDFIAQGRAMAEVMPGEYLAVMSAGAYAMTMASNYNSRQRPCELMVDGDKVYLIRRRDALDELWQNEIKLP